ncbi:MAG: peptidase S9 [Cytophagaceae bacterium]|nr:peptidase S9 [Cytophagaceae bacterium]|tara:strand:- start:14827 stop:15663 length:837 start_codon:yes stop_codon:yes gene_type:complete
MKKIIVIVTFLIGSSLLAQNVKYDQVDVYKKTETRDLNISFVFPDNWKERTRWPMIVFYHGGGWAGGDIKQFSSQAAYFAGKGMVCALVEYRVAKVDHTDPFTALMDAKSAMRYLKKNSDRYRIDPNRIVAVGGSAGGHLAAAVDLVEGYNDPNDDLDINTKVSGLVLFNPVIDNGPNGYGYERVGEAYKQFSPFHQDKSKMADVLIMVGTNDKHIPVQTMKDFCKDAKDAGSNCEVIFYKDATHGFFNKGKGDGHYYIETRDEMEKFLRARNFICEE